MNLDAIIQGTITSVQNVLVDDVGDVSEFMRQALEANKASIEELLVAKKNNEITQSDFEYELERERLVFESELLAAQVMTKAMVAKISDIAFGQLAKLVNPLV